MNFKLYDILSSLIPGFLILLTILELSNIPFDNDKAIAYTAIAFLLGFIVNTISSWLEDIYYFTWGGKPSTMLLDGKSIWKVKFYHSLKAKELLKLESQNPNSSNDELFSIAMRYANHKDSRVEDLNSAFAFSRSLLTCAIIGGVFLLINNSEDWKYYALIIPLQVIIWLRCKQRGYYYAREVLNCYLQAKKEKPTT